MIKALSVSAGKKARLAVMVVVELFSVLKGEEEDEQQVVWSARETYRRRFQGGQRTMRLLLRPVDEEGACYPLVEDGVKVQLEFYSRAVVVTIVALVSLCRMEEQA